MRRAGVKIGASLLGLVVLVPAMVGPLPAAARTLQVPLCSGTASATGATAPVVPVDGPLVPQGPCCAKGCHAGASRKRVDRSQ